MACIQAYGKSFVSERKDLALICNEWTDGLHWSSARLPVQNQDSSHLSSEDTTTFPYDWICTYPSDHGSAGYFSYLSHPNSTTNQPCYPNTVIDTIGVDKAWYYPIPIGNTDGNNSIEYCLSQKTLEHCQLQFSIDIMVVILVANFLKLLCLLYTIWRVKSPTIVTVGDAISSFLQDPDHATIGQCTLSKLCVEDENWFGRSKRVPGSWRTIYHPVSAQPQPWIGKRLLWSDGLSKTRRNFCYLW